MGNSSSESAPNEEEIREMSASKHTVDIQSAHAKLVRDISAQDEDCFTAIALHPSNQRAALGCYSGLIQILDLGTHCIDREFDAHIGAVWGIAVSKGGDWIVSCGHHDMAVNLWSFAEDECIHSMEGHTDSVRAVAISDDCKWIVSGSIGNTCRLWQPHCLHGENEGQVSVLAGHRESVYAVTFTPDSDRVVSGSWDCTCRVWCVKTGICLLSLEEHQAAVTAIAISHDGEWILSGSSDCTAKLWRFHSNKENDFHFARCVKTLNVRGSGVSSVAFSETQQKVLTGTADGFIRIWDKSSGVSLDMWKGHVERVSALINGYEDTVLSLSDDSTCKKWSCNLFFSPAEAGMPINEDSASQAVAASDEPGISTMKFGAANLETAPTFRTSESSNLDDIQKVHSCDDGNTSSEDESALNDLHALSSLDQLRQGQVKSIPGDGGASMRSLDWWSVHAPVTYADTSHTFIHEASNIASTIEIPHHTENSVSSDKSNPVCEVNAGKTLVGATLVQREDGDEDKDNRGISPEAVDGAKAFSISNAQVIYKSLDAVKSKTSDQKIFLCEEEGVQLLSVLESHLSQLELHQFSSIAPEWIQHLHVFPSQIRAVTASRGFSWSSLVQADLIDVIVAFRTEIVILERAILEATQNLRMRNEEEYQALQDRFANLLQNPSLTPIQSGRLAYEPHRNADFVRYCEQRLLRKRQILSDAYDHIILVLHCTHEVLLLLDGMGDSSRSSIMILKKADRQALKIASILINRDQMMPSMAVSSSSSTRQNKTIAQFFVAELRRFDRDDRYDRLRSFIGRDLSDSIEERRETAIRIFEVVARKLLIADKRTIFNLAAEESIGVSELRSKQQMNNFDISSSLPVNQYLEFLAQSVKEKILSKGDGCDTDVLAPVMMNDLLKGMPRPLRNIILRVLISAKSLVYTFSFLNESPDAVGEEHNQVTSAASEPALRVRSSECGAETLHHKQQRSNFVRENFLRSDSSENATELNVEVKMDSGDEDDQPVQPLPLRSPSSAVTLKTLVRKQSVRIEEQTKELDELIRKSSSFHRHASFTAAGMTAPSKHGSRASLCDTTEIPRNRSYSDPFRDEDTSMLFDGFVEEPSDYDSSTEQQKRTAAAQQRHLPLRRKKSLASRSL